MLLKSELFTGWSQLPSSLIEALVGGIDVESPFYDVNIAEKSRANRFQIL